MLLNRRNPSEAISAIIGILTNQVEKSYNESIFELLIEAARPDNRREITSLAIGAITLIMCLYDQQIRSNSKVVEDVQDILVGQQDIALPALIAFNKFMPNLSFITHNTTDVRQTLIYRLVVVGEAAHQAFDRNSN